MTRATLATPLTDDDGNTVTDHPSVVDRKASTGGIGLLAALALAVTGRRRRTTVDGSREPVSSSTGAQ